MKATLVIVENDRDHRQAKALVESLIKFYESIGSSAPHRSGETDWRAALVCPASSPPGVRLRLWAVWPSEHAAEADLE
jgi:hypothetical protein